MPRVDHLDLNLFDFDYDVTFMVFFLDDRENVYGRYGGREPVGADSRHSLAGLKYTMQSVLRMHEQPDKQFAAKASDTPKHLRDMAGVRVAGARGCMHCHNVKEALNSARQRNGESARDFAWRYPLPANLGFDVELDRGNVVTQVQPQSPAALGGLQPGDLLRRIHGVPIHSFGDIQFALDRAPKKGAINVMLERDGSTRTSSITLADDWRQTDIAWRASMQRHLASARLYGVDLKPDEKKALGLAPTHLAFRQRESVPFQSRSAGVRPGDIILGLDGKTLAMDADEFLRFVPRNYFIGEKASINIIRDGTRIDLPVTFIR